MGKLGDNVKNYGLFFVVFMAVGAGVVAANTYNDGSVVGPVYKSNPVDP
jgi:hypothetical protein